MFWLRFVLLGLILMSAGCCCWGSGSNYGPAGVVAYPPTGAGYAGSSCGCGQ